MLKRKVVAAALAAGCVTGGGLAAPAFAAETEADKQPVVLTSAKKTTAEAPKVTKEAEPAPEAAPSDGKFTFGGAIRVRYDLRFDDAKPSGEQKTSNHFSFDTLALKAKYDSSTFFASGQYRIYGGSFIYGKRAGYDKYPGEVHFPMWGYGGYKFTPEDSVTAGINQVPFGLTPYFGSSFFESLGFTMGVEEVYNVGAKYSHVGPKWSWDIGFYPTMTPNGEGISRESARYSTNMVKADSYVPFGSDNHERNMVIGRIDHHFVKTDVASFTAGASIWLSQVHNLDTHRDGFKSLIAAHFDAKYGNWGFKGIYVRQDIDAKNPGRDDMITLGGYDGSFNVATHGNFVSGEINYTIPNDIGPFNVMPYLNYSAFYKDKGGFKASQRYILGAAWTYKKDPRLVIYSEGILGKNDPYVGAGQYTGGLAQGGDNRWKASVIVNIGFYF